MTTDRRDDDHRSTTADERDRHVDSCDTAPTASDDGNTFATLFDQAPANVTLDDVTTALQSVRSGDGE